MKRTIALLTIATVFALGTSMAYAAQKRYPLKSGIVEYQMNGAHSGTQTVYFDNFGAKEARFMDMQMGKKTMRALMLIDGDWAYNVDLERKMAMRMNIPKMKEMMKQFGQEIPEFDERKIKEWESKKIGTDNVLGKTCDVYQIEKTGGSVCVWKWLPLKMESAEGKKSFSLIATRIDENANIPKDKLSIPAGVEVMDMPDIGALMQGVPGGMQKSSGQATGETEQSPEEMKKMMMNKLKGLF